MAREKHFSCKYLNCCWVKFQWEGTFGYGTRPTLKEPVRFSCILISVRRGEKYADSRCHVAIWCPANRGGPHLFSGAS